MKRCQIQDRQATERSEKMEFLALSVVHLFASCGQKMISQLLMRAFFDQAAHFFDLQGQMMSQTRTNSMPNLAL